MTKKAIREKLAPMSKHLWRTGTTPKAIELMGLRITCTPLYKSPGQIGYAWLPHFQALDPTINAPIGRIVHGGNLNTIVDQLYSRQQRAGVAL